MKTAWSRRILLVVVLLSAAVVTVSYAASGYESNQNENLQKYPVFRQSYFAAPDAKDLSSSEIQKALIAVKQKTQTTVKERKENSTVKIAGTTSTHKKTTTIKVSTSTKVSSSQKNAVTYKPAPKKTPVISREEKIRIEQNKAEAILASYIKKYPILEGVKIYVKDCPNNWEGCAYYTKGIILIDPDHKHSLEEIIAHEVRHIIDWRSDGKIDYNDYHK